jgi:hypothetical protein
MSAGTLIALGGNQIVMSDTSQLGPLDMQIPHPSKEKQISALDIVNPASYLVGLAATASSRFFKKIREDSRNRISVEDAMKIAYENSVRLFEPIVGQLDPIELSRSNRVLSTAEKYGVILLLKYSLCDEKQGDSDYAETLIQYLVYGYPEHGFGIFYDEMASFKVNVKFRTDYIYWDKIWEKVVKYIQADFDHPDKSAKIIEFFDLKTEDQNDQ